MRREDVRETVSGVMLLLLCAPILHFAVQLAMNRPMWFDEIATWHIAHLPDMKTVWAALAQAADGNPPGFYMLTRIGLGVDDSSLGLRLPAIAGFVVAGVGMFRIARRWAHPMAAFTGVVALVASGGAPFIVEARPYGLLLGAGAMALLCWVRWRETGRFVDLAGLALSLAAGVSFHYAGFLMAIPVAGGEAAAQWRERKPRMGVFAAIGLGLAPLIAYLPLITSATTYAGSTFAVPRPSSFISVYAGWLGALPLAVFVSVAAAWLWHVAPVSWKLRLPEDGAIPAHVQAAIGLTLLIPCFTFLTGLAMQTFVARYSVAFLIGLGLAIAAAVARFPLLLPGALALSLGLAYYNLGTPMSHSELMRVPNLGEIEGRKDLRLAVAPVFNYMRMHWISTDELRRRSAGLLTAREVTNSQVGGERSLLKLEPWVRPEMNFRLKTADEFLESKQPFLLLLFPPVAVRGDTNWLQRLKDARAEVTPLTLEAPMLYLVTPQGGEKK